MLAFSSSLMPFGLFFFTTRTTMDTGQGLYFESNYFRFFFFFVFISRRLIETGGKEWQEESWNIFVLG